MANIVTENFNSGMGAWTAADFVASAGSPNYLVDATAAVLLDSGKDDGLPHVGYYSSDCTPNHSISFTWIGGSGNADRFCEAVVRLKASDPTTFYALRDHASGSGTPGAKLIKSVAGVVTELGEINKASGTHEVPVKLTPSIAGSALVGRIQRLDDDTYLASDGTWSVAAVDCFSVTDGDISASGDCRAGWRHQFDNRFNNIHDNATIDSIAVVDPPATPTSFTLTAVSPTDIDGSWADPNSDATAFEVQIDLVNTFDSGDLQTFSMAASGTLAGNFDPGETYYGRIRASNAGGTSGWSSTQEVIMPDLILASAVSRGRDSRSRSRP